MNEMNSSIADNLKTVLENIERARAKTDTDKVSLIAVSKTKPVDVIFEASKYGIRHFGENKANEMSEKYDITSELDVCYHFIGHLQRNKVKTVVGKASLIHSLDSLRLAIKIDEEARKKDVVVDVLVQINIGNESTKYGIDISETAEFVEELKQFSNIRLRGLMCTAPYVSDAEENRELFRKMREVFIDIRGKNNDNEFIDILSMGMSADYEVAIEEGTNMVRVGTAIFGERDYNR